MSCEKIVTSCKRRSFYSDLSNVVFSTIVLVAVRAIILKTTKSTKDG